LVAALGPAAPPPRPAPATSAGPSAATNPQHHSNRSQKSQQERLKPDILDTSTTQPRLTNWKKSVVIFLQESYLEQCRNITPAT